MFQGILVTEKIGWLFSLGAWGSEKSIIIDVKKIQDFPDFMFHFLVVIVQKEAFLRLIHSNVNLLNYWSV